MADNSSLDQSYLDAIKGFEGYTEKPTWDYRQWSSGYGTRASGPNDIQPRDVLEQRFQTEIGKAAGAVDAAFPELPEGARAALTSLTYNAGSGWINGGLGNAVRQGDWGTANNIFRQYSNAGGQPSQGLINRRAQEATWLTGAQQPPSAAASGSPAGMPVQAGDTPSYAPGLTAASLGAQTTPAGVPMFGGQQQPGQQSNAMANLAKQIVQPDMAFPTSPFKFAQAPAPLQIQQAPIQYPQQMQLLRRPT